MATITLAQVETSLVSDQVLLFGGRTNVTGDMDDDLVLPAGYGTVVPIQLVLFATGWATMPSLANNGFWAAVYHAVSGSRPAGDLGVSRYLDCGSFVHGLIQPDHPVNLAQGDVIRVVGAELDANVSGTVDITYRLRARRLRTT